MAQDDDVDVVVVENAEDSAKAMTSGIVFATFAVLLVAIFVMEKALGTWFNLGPFKP
jgi:hypothetical protein